MIRRAVVVVVVIAGLLSACSDDKASSSRPSGTLADGSEVADSPAPVPTDGGATAPGGAVDCAAVTDAFGHAIVNIQLIAQLGTQSDVTQWSPELGTMSDFGRQLDVLATLEPYDAGVADAIAFYRGANEIAQRGYAGDSTAPADLATYVGPDVAEVLGKKIPFAMASDAAGC